ncbi:BolA family protein [Wolbachia endosymbiont of Pentidionis agamae]|uniref:BolA family protein n=1 Tax=Wolbachia endosymbiont of Pentidionis agamae TaxID=3110435 RepID=UPI0038CD4ADA
MIQLIKEKIISSINVVSINIIDESEKHADHYFSSSSTLPSHIKLILISDDFIGMSIFKRHKLLYELLKDEVKLIHAISLLLYTQAEYKIKNRV